MNHIANRNLRFSWEEDGAYRETLSLLENGEALPVLRSAPYASVLPTRGCIFPICRKTPGWPASKRRTAGSRFAWSIRITASPAWFRFQKIRTRWKYR